MVEQTLWTSYTPETTNATDAQQYGLGTTFYSVASGWSLGAKWRFPDTLPSGSVTAKLWRVDGDDGLLASGTELASATFSSPVAGVANEVRWSSPVVLAANTPYVVSIKTPDRYVVSGGYFGSTTVTSGDLRAPQNGSDPIGVGTLHNGKLNDLTGHQFPNATFNSANYWVDVIFTTDDPSAATPKDTSDAAVFTDLLALAAALNAGETVSASDALLLTTSLSVVDTVSVTDAVTAAANLPTTENVSFLDTVSVARYATISETVSFDDQLTTMAFYTITDGITSTDGLAPISQIITENIAVVEAVAAAAGMTVSDTISFIDTVMRQIEGQDDSPTSPITLVRRTPHITIKRHLPEITIRRI